MNKHLLITSKVPNLQSYALTPGEKVNESSIL